MRQHRVSRIVHPTPIPLEGWREAYEYPLPICSYEGGLDHPYDDVFNSLEELIAAFLAGDPQQPLFDRIDEGLRKLRP
jgi:hypothetical protein